MQYLLISKEQVTDGRFHETLPDGRVILPLTDVRMIGNLTGVDIIGSARELKALIEAQRKATNETPDPGEVEEVDPEMGVVPEEPAEEEGGEA